MILGVGLFAQVFQAAQGSWAIGGPDRAPEAYPVVGSDDAPPYRVLWLGAPTGDAFVPPGGTPDGFVALRPEDLSPGLKAKLAREAERGLDPARRVAMAKRL